MIECGLLYIKQRKNQLHYLYFGLSWWSEAVKEILGLFNFFFHFFLQLLYLVSEHSLLTMIPHIKHQFLMGKMK